MRQIRYIGTFVFDNGNTKTITVNCNGFKNALILICAKAIEDAIPYENLTSIKDEHGSVKFILDFDVLNKILT